MIEIELPTAGRNSRLRGFQASDQVVLLNQNQPSSATMTTGTMTPHTVTAPIRPVMRAPPKFATVVMTRRMMVQMQVCTGDNVVLNSTMP